MSLLLLLGQGEEAELEPPARAVGFPTRAQLLARAEALGDIALLYAPESASDPLVDLSGNGHHGAFSGGASLVEPGVVEGGAACDLDGDDDYIDTGWETRTNLICNPSAEGGAETTKVAAVVANATLNDFSGSFFNPEDGTRSFFMEATATGASASAIMVFQGSIPSGPNLDRYPVQEGRTYYFSAVGCTIGDRPAVGQRLRVAWYNAAGTMIANQEAAPVPSVGSQEPPALMATAPAGAVAGLAGFGNVLNIANGEKSKFWIDGLMFTDRPGPFFPTAGQIASGEAGFAGTPYLSESDIGPFARGTQRTFVGMYERQLSDSFETLFGGEGSSAPVLALVGGSADAQWVSDFGDEAESWSGAWPGFNQAAMAALRTDHATDAVGLSIDGQPAVTQTHSDDYADPGTLLIGGGGVNGWGGRALPFIVFRRALTDAELHFLYGRRTIHVREKPPLRLAHDIELPNGRHVRWGEDEANPANVPSGYSHASVIPGGYDTAQATLPRKPGLDYGDTQGYATWKTYGAGGEVVSETRLERAPRASGEQVSVSPEGIGWKAHLEDNKTAQMIFVDRDLGRWGDASRARQVRLYGITHRHEGFSTAPDSTLPSLQTAFDGPLDGGYTKRAEAWFDAGAGNRVATIYWDWNEAAGSVVLADALWNWMIGMADADDPTTVGGDENTGDLRTQGRTGYYSPATARRYAFLWLVYNSTPALDDGKRYIIDWRNVAVYGDHDLPRYGPDPGGLLASDIVPYALSRWAPLLNYGTGANGTISPSSFVIPHISFPEPTTVLDMVTQSIRFGLPDWAVWDDRTFYLHPRGARGRKWMLRVGPGQLQETGQAMDRVWNGILVRYQDVDGTTKVVGPPGSGVDVEDAVLQVTDPLNPANLAGIPRIDMLDMGKVSVPGAAIEVGRIFLEQANQLDRSGQAVVVGYAMDDRGILRPASQIKAGDTAPFVDASDSSERRIVRVQYDHPTRTASLDLDAPPEAMDALLERLGVELVRLGIG